MTVAIGLMPETVFVLQDRYMNEAPAVFSSEEKLLEYYQQLNPHAKHLRIKRDTYFGSVSVLNHNVHVARWWIERIHEVSLDAALEE